MLWSLFLLVPMFGTSQILPELREQEKGSAQRIRAPIILTLIKELHVTGLREFLVF